MSVATTNFKHVSYLWDEEKAAELAGDEVGLLIYRSNLLGLVVILFRRGRNLIGPNAFAVEFADWAYRYRGHRIGDCP